MSECKWREAGCGMDEDIRRVFEMFRAYNPDYRGKVRIDGFDELGFRRICIEDHGDLDESIR